MTNSNQPHNQMTCEDRPCPDPRCVNGYYALATGTVGLLLDSVATTAEERLAVRNGAEPRMPSESIRMTRSTVQGMLSDLESAPVEVLRFFVTRLEGMATHAIRPPFDPNDPAAEPSSRTTDFVRP